MKYIFNIESIGYIRYRLSKIISLKSRYSYVMFLFLMYHWFRKSWAVEVDDLKQFLGCTEACYSQFKVFNDRVLKLCKNELEEKLDCHFTYTPIKKGRKVVAVQFTVETNSTVVTESGIDVVLSTERPVWQTALDELRLSPQEIAEIYEHLVLVPDRKLPDEKECSGSIDIQRYHYLQLKVKELIRRDAEEKPIPHKYKYLLAMVDNDCR